MLERVASLFREAPPAPRLEDPKVVDALYRKSRNHVLYGSMAAYALFYFCRNNLSAGLSPMGKELGYTNEQLGTIGATLYVTYAISKFAFGLVADKASPRVLLVGGVVASAFANFWFGNASAIGVLAALWGLNGLVQGMGAPASAKVLAVWFTPSERGTKTGIWNISHQAGGAIALSLAGGCAQLFGWRGAFVGPAIVALVGAFLVTRFLHDRPESRGLPPIEEFAGEIIPSETTAAAESQGSLLVSRVFLNWRLWLIAFASGCTYVVRMGTLGWVPKFLKESDPQNTVWLSSALGSFLEWGGIPGAIAAGWLSDRVFRARRMPVVIAWLLLLSGSTWLLFHVHGRASIAAVACAVGFFTYGPQMLLAGVAPVDVSSRRVAAAAVGFTGLMSYAASAIQSKVTGWLVDQPQYGWRGAFAFWSITALVGAVLCLPMWNQRAGQAD